MNHSGPKTFLFADVCQQTKIEEKRYCQSQLILITQNWEYEFTELPIILRTKLIPHHLTHHISLSLQVLQGLFCLL